MAKLKFVVLAMMAVAYSGTAAAQHFDYNHARQYEGFHRYYLYPYYWSYGTRYDPYWSYNSSYFPETYNGDGSYYGLGYSGYAGDGWYGSYWYW